MEKLDVIKALTLDNLEKILGCIIADKRVNALEF